MANQIIMVTMVMAGIMLGMSSAGVIAPVLPPIAPAVPVAYTKAVPLNIPPFSSRVDISNRVLASPYTHHYYATAGNNIVAPAVVGVAGAAPLAYGPTVLG